MRKPVNSKNDFVRRFTLGEFGNKPKSWDNVSTWFADPTVDQEALFHLRNRVKGGETFYNLWYAQLKNMYMEYDWVGSPDWYVSEMAPTPRTSLQGEVRRSERGLELFYSTVRLPMRDALAKSSETVTGLQARAAIMETTDAGSYDWIMELLHLYPDHIVEFSSYEIPCGSMADQGYRSLIWEVRNY